MGSAGVGGDVGDLDPSLVLQSLQASGQRHGAWRRSHCRDMASADLHGEKMGLKSTHSVRSVKVVSCRCSQSYQLPSCHPWM